MTTSPAPTKSWFGLWVLLTTIWGFSFFFIKVAGSFLAPTQQTFGRMFFGAIVLIGVVAFSGRSFIVRGPAIKHLALIAISAQVIPFTIFAFAVHHITSIAAGLLNSTMTLWTAIFALVMLPEEKLSKFRATGLLLGFLGLMILMGVWEADFKTEWGAYVACAMCTMGYSFAAIWTRKHLSPMGLDPISAVATQLTIGAVLLGVVTALTPSPITSWPITGVLAVMALGLFGTGAALVINYVLLARAGAIATSTVTYAMPVVSTLAGALLLSEQLHWYEPIGAVIVLLGIAIVQQFIKPRSVTK